ncbi:MAG: hypothetical protein AMXMBFR84_48240 [Candidatus Hydrogenedentota bacterium]
MGTNRAVIAISEEANRAAYGIDTALARQTNSHCQKLGNSERLPSLIRPHLFDLGDYSRARLAAMSLHAGQRRRTGEPFVMHPIRVAQSALVLGVNDCTIIQAVLLHDVIEQSQERASPGYLEGPFSISAEALGLIELLTKDETESTDDYFHRIATSFKASFGKCLDRLDNLRTMPGAFTQKKAREYFDETRDYVLPLCDRYAVTKNPLESKFQILHSQLTLAMERATLWFDAQLEQEK